MGDELISWFVPVPFARLSFTDTDTICFNDQIATQHFHDSSFHFVSRKLNFAKLNLCSFTSLRTSATSVLSR